MGRAGEDLEGGEGGELNDKSCCADRGWSSGSNKCIQGRSWVLNCIDYFYYYYMYVSALSALWLRMSGEGFESLGTGITASVRHISLGCWN